MIIEFGGLSNNPYFIFDKTANTEGIETARNKSLVSLSVLYHLPVFFSEIIKPEYKLTPFRKETTL